MERNTITTVLYHLIYNKDSHNILNRGVTEVNIFFRYGMNMEKGVTYD